MSNGQDYSTLRQHRLPTMQVNSFELSVIEEKMRQAGIKRRGEYIRKMALAGHIINIDASPLNKTVYLLANIASNINQISKRLNTNQADTLGKKEIEELKTGYEEMRVEFNDMFVQMGELFNLKRGD